MSSRYFFCQCCSQPLKLRQLQADLPAAQGEPLEAKDSSGLHTELPDSEKLQPPSSSEAFPDRDSVSEPNPRVFTLLGEPVSQRSLSSIQKDTLDLFDIFWGQKDMEQPLCQDCTDSLLAQVDTQLALAEADSQSYARCLEGLRMEEEEEEKGAVHAGLRAELRELELEEQRLIRQLEDMDQDGARVASELREAQAREAELSGQETEQLKECGALQSEQLELSEQLDSLKNQLRYARKQLRRLKKFNILKATFDIWEDGPLGVINNFRLGRLPGVPVAWDEISAAWGQAALLLVSLARLVKLQFQGYEPVPRGDHSYMQSVAGAAEALPLFSDGRHSVAYDNTFDQGMVAFLYCLQQFVQEAEKGEDGLCLPYRVLGEEGLLEDTWGSCRVSYSIRTHLNTEEQWTLALKFMLVDLKWSLAWASAKYCQK